MAARSKPWIEVPPKRNPTSRAWTDDEARAEIAKLTTKPPERKHGRIYTDADLANREVARDLALERGFKDLILKMDVEDFLVKNKLDYDAHVYTKERWLLRDEKYGKCSLLTITSEGDFSRVMNEGVPVGMVRKFEAFLKKEKLYWEQSFSWAFHLYSTEPLVYGPVPLAGRRAVDGYSTVALDPETGIGQDGDAGQTYRNAVAFARAIANGGAQRGGRDVSLSAIVYADFGPDEERVTLFSISPPGYPLWMKEQS